MQYDFVAIPDSEIPQAVEPIFQHVVTTYVSEANKTVSMWRGVPDDLLDALVPSLVLQPLVENAIRHAIEPSAEGGRVRISASRRADELTLIVRNDGVAGPGASATTSGIGLTNLEARLRQLYGPSHEFHAGFNAGEFIVSLTLPWHARAARDEPVAVA